MRRNLAIILIVIGLILLTIPLAGRLVMEYKISSTRNLVEELTVEDLRDNGREDAEYDYSRIRDINERSVFGIINESYQKAIVGHLIIADLGVSLPILKGTTDPHLMVGATTMKKDQEMGQGNYPLAGHYYSRNKYLLFSPILEIEKGTLIKITDKEAIYEYQVYDASLVAEDALYLLENKEAEKHGQPIISLVTCYYSSKNGQRFIVRGELVNQYPYDIKHLM